LPILGQLELMSTYNLTNTCINLNSDYNYSHATSKYGHVKNIEVHIHILISYCIIKSLR
jgi:hypothetical protein